MTYVQGFILPVFNGKKEAFRQTAVEAAPYFEGHGAARTLEGWEVDVPHGETTDMYRAVDAGEGEHIVFSWIEWPSKQVWDKAHKAIGEDENMQPPAEMPFDGKRMIYAEFDLLGEKGKSDGPGYVQGYVAPVRKDRKDEFAAMCAVMRNIAMENGALRALDSFAGTIVDGKVTDFKRAVKAEKDEGVAFGFTEWASKEAFDKGVAKMRADSRMPQPGSDMPVDGRRMIYGGFEVLLDTDRQG